MGQRGRLAGVPDGLCHSCASQGRAAGSEHLLVVCVFVCVAGSGGPGGGRRERRLWREAEESQGQPDGQHRLALGVPGSAELLSAADADAGQDEGEGEDQVRLERVSLAGDQAREDADADSRCPYGCWCCWCCWGHLFVAC